MIDSPYDYCHPAFSDQQEYRLVRAVADTGDEQNDSAATLTFQHSVTNRQRVFRFFRVHFAHNCGTMLTAIRGYLPVYVATLEGRQWEGGVDIEVGDADPGNEWFWAEQVSEVTDQPTQ